MILLIIIILNPNFKFNERDTSRDYRWAWSSPGRIPAFTNLLVSPGLSVGGAASSTVSDHRRTLHTPNHAHFSAFPSSIELLITFSRRLRSIIDSGSSCSDFWLSIGPSALNLSRFNDRLLRLVAVSEIRVASLCARVMSFAVLRAIVRRATNIPRFLNYKKLPEIDHAQLLRPPLSLGPWRSSSYRAVRAVTNKNQ